MIYLATLALVSCYVVSTVSADEVRSYKGIWQFEGKDVFVSISDTGKAYQCRIASEGTLFEAYGSVVAPGQVEWEPVSTTTRSGEPFDLAMLGDKFTWGTDKLSSGYGADEIVLDGQFGSYTYTKVKIPKPCSCVGRAFKKKAALVSETVTCAKGNES